MTLGTNEDIYYSLNRKQIDPSKMISNKNFPKRKEKKDMK